MKKYKSYTMIKYTKEEFQNKVLNKRSVYYMISTPLPLLFIPVINWQLGVLLFLLLLLLNTSMFLSDAIAYFQCSRDFNKIEQPTWELFNKIIHEAQWDYTIGTYVEISGERYTRYKLRPAFSPVEMELITHGFDIAHNRIVEENVMARNKEASNLRGKLTTHLCKQVTCDDVKKAAASGNSQFQYFLKHGKLPTSNSGIKNASR